MRLFGPSGVSSIVTSELQFPRKVGGAAQPNATVSGTTFSQSVGNLRPTEFVVISKGETKNQMPDWSNGALRNMLAFGDLVDLQSGTLLTAYCRQASEGATLSTIEGKVSYDRGATWSTPFTLLTASDYGAGSFEGGAVLMQTASGRIYFWTSVRVGSSGINWTVYMSYTDAPDGATGWSTPAEQRADALLTAQYILAQKPIQLADGTLLMFPYGLKAGQPSNRDTSCLASTDGGATWTRRSLPFDGATDGRSYVEVGACIRPDGSILLACRDIDSLQTIFRVSSDSGVTWSANGSQIISGSGKPVLLTLNNGSIVLLNRSGSSTEESCLYVCRDGSGTGATSWSPEQDFDWRHTRYLYGAMIQMMPNAVGMAFAAGLSGSTSTDWLFTCFTDGCAVLPTGSAVLRDVQCEGLAAHGQIIAPGGQVAPILNYPLTNGAADQQTCLLAIVDAMIAAGFATQHPSIAGNVIGMWEPWRIPTTINDWIDTFVNADSGTVVASASRCQANETLAPVQLVGTWGTTSNQGKLVTASGGNGILYWDFGAGDGTYIVHQIMSTTSLNTLVRLTDASNYLWISVSTGGVCSILKFVAGASTSLGSTTISAPVAGNKVAVKVVMAGAVISMYTDFNVSGTTPVFSSTPTVTVTLSGGDSALFPNTLTKSGIRTTTANLTLYTYASFHDHDFTAGDKFGECPEYTGTTPAGGSLSNSMLQGTANNKFVLAQDNMLFNALPYAYQGASPAAACYMQTPAFTALAGPFTLFWAGLLLSDGGQRSIAKGVGANTPRLTVSNVTRIISVAATSGVNLPAFSAYPNGPFVLRGEFSGTTGTIYKNGYRIATGSISTLGTITRIMMGDGTVNTNAYIVHTSAFNAILSSNAAKEHERMIYDRFKIRAWNPR